jgi:dipeptidyl aminopeptidase/acylaminoacyl peptidase
MKILTFSIIVVSLFLIPLVFLHTAQAQNTPIHKENATLLVSFSEPKFAGYQGGSFTLSHDDSMFAYSTTVRDLKSGNWKVSLWLYFLKNDTSRSLDLNSNLSQIGDISFSPDDKKLLFVGNGCDDNPSHTTFYVFNPSNIHLNCNTLTNVHSADWMPDGSIILLQNNEENDTVSIYKNGIQKLLYLKQITPPYISLNSSHIEFIKASPDGKKIALWYFVSLSHKTQILNVDDGKIIDTFDGGHPRWSHDGKMLLYTLPTNPGRLSNGARAVITYINLLDVDNNKTSTINSIPLGIDDISFSEDGSKIFYAIKVYPPYEFMNFTSGVYEIGLRHNDTVYPLGPDFGLPSTLKQFKSGVKPTDITCQVYLQRIFKTEDGSPACVKPGTAQKLIERGWGKYTVSITDGYKQEMNGTISGVVSVYVYGGPISLDPNRSAHYEVDVYATDGITIVGKSISDVNGHYSLQLPTGHYIIYTYNDTKQEGHSISVYPNTNTIFNILYNMSVP